MVHQDVAPDPSSDEEASESEEDCEHSFVLKDDLGYVCRICGVIDRGIETIFEFQYNKVRFSFGVYILIFTLLDSFSLPIWLHQHSVHGIRIQIAIGCSNWWSPPPLPPLVISKYWRYSCCYFYDKNDMFIDA